METESTSDFEITVTETDREEFKRLDVFLAARIPQF